MFRRYVERYDSSDYTPGKIAATILLACIIATCFISGLSPHLNEPETPYDAFLVFTFFAGIFSAFLAFFPISYLTNLLVASSDYFDSRSFWNYRGDSFRFSFDTLYKVTLKNPIFYYFSLSFGYFAGVFERYSYMKNIEQFENSWAVFQTYYFTYVKYPVLTFFIGILLISLVYVFLAKFHKPLGRFLKKSAFLENVQGFITTWFFYAKNKAFVMTLFGLLPAAMITIYLTGFLPESISFWKLFNAYGAVVVLAYLLVPTGLTIYEAIKNAKQANEETSERNTTLDGETIKAKQTSYEKIDTIYVSDYIDGDIRKAIHEINEIVIEINPYLKLTDIEEAHVLKRITEVEVLTLIKHYNKLPGDTKKEVKQVLLEQLHNAKKVAEEIAQISKKFHYEAFQKQIGLMDARYSMKKDAN